MAGEDRAVLLYYCYMNPLWTEEAVESMLAWQRDACASLSLSGRAKIASEGLNVNLTGSRGDLEAYCTQLLEWRAPSDSGGGGGLGPVDFKLAPTTRSLEFRGIKVWRAAEVCALGAAVDPAAPAGKHLTPAEFHGVLAAATAGERPPGSVVLLDARNLYETRLGRFEVADPRAAVVTIAPPTLTFAELPRHIDALGREATPAAASASDSASAATPSPPPSLAGKTVLMYCTGGVRCERASQYLLAAHPEVGEVCQLAGGIQRYLEAFPDGGFWRGLNYVFDRREVHGPTQAPAATPSAGQGSSSGGCGGCSIGSGAGSGGGTGGGTGGGKGGSATRHLIANCLTCGAPWGSYKGKRKCGGCRMLVLVCELCQSRGSDKGASLRCEVCRGGGGAAKGAAGEVSGSGAAGLGDAEGDAQALAESEGDRQAKVAKLPAAEP